MPGATVTATISGQPFVALSDFNGNYILANLPFGIATLSAHGTSLQGSFGPMQVLLDPLQSTVVVDVQLSTGPPPPPVFP